MDSSKSTVPPGTAPVNTAPAGDSELTRMAETFQCLADPTRLKIVNAMLDGELCVRDLTGIIGMSQPAVSHHLRQLRQMRLVRPRRLGKAVFYRLDDEHIRLLFRMCLSHVSEPDAGGSRAS